MNPSQDARNARQRLKAILAVKDRVERTKRLGVLADLLDRRFWRDVEGEVRGRWP